MSNRERAAVDWSAEYSVHVREDLYETGRHNEDGEMIIRSRFYLVATDKIGHRWASPNGHRSAASAKSERRRLSRDFNPIKAGWHEIDPMYGSEAWTPAVEARIAYEERQADAW